MIATVIIEEIFFVLFNFSICTSKTAISSKKARFSSIVNMSEWKKYPNKYEWICVELGYYYKYEWMKHSLFENRSQKKVGPLEMDSEFWEK